MNWRRNLAVLLLGLAGHGAVAGQERIELHAGGQVYVVVPETLELTVRGTGEPEAPFSISAPQEPARISDLKTSPTGAAWRDLWRGVEIQVTAEDRGSLEVAIGSAASGTSVTWPVQPLAEPEARALIWPRREGHYIPLGDRVWTDSLREETHNTLEGLSMPFWGVETAGGVFSCVVSTQFHNEITFGRETSASLVLRFSHSFREGEPPVIRYRIRRGGRGESPLMPAFEYRRRLREEGEFVSFDEKVRKTPAAEKLLGAPHVYLWGGGILTRFDLARGDARRFAGQLAEGADVQTSSPAGRIFRSLSEEGREAVKELADSSYKLPFAQSTLARELSSLLARADFYEAAVWNGIRLSAETETLLRRRNEGMSPDDTIRLDRLLLHDAFPGSLPPPDTWGGSLSPAMLEGFRAAGLDRLRIGLDGWEAMTGNAAFAREAQRLGYLIGPYDSYHSIHDPRLRGTEGTWPTAQFDGKLYETGPIVNRDGTRRKGFKQKGFLLSPLAARPYVERRVTANAEKAPFNYYFFDCDGFGQVYDDYSPLHPATEMSDAASRSDRMSWVTGRFGAVVGTEGGSAYAAGAVHLFEGVFQDHFGWGDPDMANRKSPFYPGAYFPPEAPAVFFKPVPVKDLYAHLHYDPRFRLPLFEAVFHDSVISGHHWSAPTLKFSNVQTTVVLTELLYQVPPMYHLNPEEYAKRRDEISEHYRVFSPLHRISGRLPLSAFEWLTADRLVQKTVWGNQLEVVANFGPQTFLYGKTAIPAGAVAWSLDGSDPGLYVPRSPGLQTERRARAAVAE